MHVEGTGPRVRVASVARSVAAALLVIIIVSLSLPVAAAARAATVDVQTGAANAIVANAIVKPAAYRSPLLKADRILVLKSARKLELLRNGVVLKTYPIALGGNPIGPKEEAGDGKTPEGVYYIDSRQPHSLYHLALHVSYPNAADTARAAAAGRNPGGDIEIHGLPNWYGGPLDPVRFDKDWTHGCVSVGDRAIEQIWAAVDIGTPVEIRP